MHLSINRRLNLFAAVLAVVCAAVACAQPAAAPAPATAVATSPGAQPSAAAQQPTAATASPTAAAKTVREPQGKVVYAAIPGVALARADPALTAAAGIFATLWPVYDGLVWVNRTGAIKPGLATAWRSVDERTWEFTLGNYSFQNGRAVTADDVVQTFERARDPQNRLSSATLFGSVDQITKTDAKTVRLTTKTVDPHLPRIISLSLILPMQEVVQQGEKFFDQPFGTGPFKYQSIDYRNAVRFTAMGASWATPRGVPNVKDLEIRLIAEEATMAGALRTGEVDIAYPLSKDTADGLTKDGFTEVLGKYLGVLNFSLTTGGPTQDKRVRQALNHAIDKDAIIQAVVRTGVKPDSQMLGAEVLGYNPDVRAYAYDVARARQLLAEAGFAGGFKLEMSVSPSFGAPLVAQAVARYLGAVGVDAPIEILETAIYSAKISGPQSGRKAAFGNNISWERTFEPDTIWQLWTSARTAENGRRWFNDEFDRLYNQARTNLDERRRAELYKQAAKLLNEEAPVIFMWENLLPGVTRKEVKWDAGSWADMFVAALSRSS